MKFHLLIGALTLSLTLPACAQPTPQPSPAASAASAASAPSLTTTPITVQQPTQTSGNLPWVKAEVVKIDLANQRATLKHEAIGNLDMPSMTMSFKVLQAEQLKNLKIGQPILFQADKIGSTYSVLNIQSTP